MTNILFVHGTGVRKLSYEATASRLSGRLKDINKDMVFKDCLWGDQYGARLGLEGVSIPNFKFTSTDVEAESERNIPLWDLLQKDPLFELRELKSAVNQETLESPRFRTTKEQMLSALRVMKDDEEIVKVISDVASELNWEAAVSEVVESIAFDQAYTATRSWLGTLRIVISRAIVATLQRQAVDKNIPKLPLNVRQNLIDLSVNRLGGYELGGIMNWLSDRLVGIGLNLMLARATRKRDSVYNFATPIAGDIVLYQARGHRIRKFIEQKVTECDGDVIVIAHSLGGVACVDLLIERPLPQVKKLITVGSQAPFLYEIDALSSLEFGQELPAHFPSRWLNFYDTNDLLSFMGSQVFPRHCEDFAIDSQQSFPDAHSAYWDNDQFWKKLASEVE